jgi:hypothetical protein
MLDNPLNNKTSVETPITKRYDVQSLSDKIETLKTLFTKAAVKGYDPGSPQKKLHHLDVEEIYRCIIADTDLTTELVGSSYTKEHFHLALEISPLAIPEELAKKFGKVKLHDEQCRTHAALIEQKIEADNCNSVEFALNNWIFHLPLRALIYQWARMSDKQLLDCYSSCMLNFLLVAQVPACFPLLARLKLLALKLITQTPHCKEAGKDDASAE